METAADLPPDTSDNPNNVGEDNSSQGTDLTLSPNNLENHINGAQNCSENHLRHSSETQSPPPNATLDAPVSDSQDDSSDPIPEDTLEEQPPNPNIDPSRPMKRRRRRKRFFTEINGNPSFRRQKAGGGIGKEVDVDSLIAISVGFPVESLTEEEIEANVVSTIGGTQQANYIAVRNHILARWRSNASVWLTRDQALQSIRTEHKHLVDSAYSFLSEHGYINFGVTPEIKETQMALHQQAERANVIIVGAGLAGLVAARQLVGMGFKVVILEGRARPGGRVKTRKMKGDGVVAAADLGGSVLTGINGNPLGVLARQLDLPLHKVRDICPLYLPDGKAIDSEIDSRVEVSFNKLLDRVCKLRQTMIEEVKSVDVNLGTALEAFRHAYKVAEVPQERMLLNWHLANLEYANASLMSNLSMAYWDQDDPYEMGGDHCFIPGGNDTFVRELAKGLPIFYERIVQSIRYGADGVIVYASGQEFRGDMVLCTVPLGVLKHGSIEFVPELPQRKQDAIQRLGYGLLNKVALLFPYNFWGGELDTFGHLTEDSSMRGEFFLFYSYSSVSGGPLLIALVAGEAAVKFETVSPVESVRRVLQILRGIFHPKGIVVPDPVQAICTRWGKDCFTYGSYSYVAVGSSGDDYDILAESIGDGRVFFAGEATNKQYPATMHGAFLSGMREAANILREAKRRSLHVTDSQSNDIEEMDTDTDELSLLYEKPDMAFGSFCILFDPRSDDDESISLLRVKFEGKKLDCRHVCLYGLISRKQGIELSELNDDGKRMETLYLKFEVKLVGRKGISSAGKSLIRAARSRLSVGS
ncbi:lysine-specific histone demethylase 1 homolog 1 [Euphorbia lathyris]|uniref:lysine-specific histone demethylase 1 homolog 1 n=1 Tax=Euphorbia lathyris TaxID=212925 RepID=UPI003313B67C